jgi:hypothetical protein
MVQQNQQQKRPHERFYCFKTAYYKNTMTKPSENVACGNTLLSEDTSQHFHDVAFYNSVRHTDLFLNVPFPRLTFRVGVEFGG